MFFECPYVEFGRFDKVQRHDTINILRRYQVSENNGGVDDGISMQSFLQHQGTHVDFLIYWIDVK